MKGPAFFLAAGAATVAVYAEPVVYEPPEETAAYRQTAGVELAEANCLGCHSADYVEMQPRGPGFGREFWRANVSKMITVYHAPIEAGDVEGIVDYLASAYAEERHLDRPVETGPAQR